MLAGREALDHVEDPLDEVIGSPARCGVDRVSVGALTHSAPALDLSFALEPDA